QTFPRLFKYALDAIFSFSYKPLRLGMALGAAVLALTLFLALLGLAASLASFARTEYFLIFLAILFLGGIQLVCIGLFGEYVGRIYDEVRHRPLFVIQQLHRSEDVRKPALSEEIHAQQNGISRLDQSRLHLFPPFPQRLRV